MHTITISDNDYAARQRHAARLTAIARVSVISGAAILAGGLIVCLFCAVYFAATNAINFAIN